MVAIPAHMPQAAALFLRRERPSPLPGPSPIVAQLKDPAPYMAQLEHLIPKHSHEAQDGVPLRAMLAHQRDLARLLAKEVSHGRYRLHTGRAHKVVINGKARTLYAFPLTDLVVYGVVADALAQATYPENLSRTVYSYQKMRSIYDGVGDLAAYVRAHRESTSDPRRRGLYLLKRDVKDYTDTVPMEDDSPVWPLLDRAISRTGAVPEHLWGLLRDIVRPPVRLPSGQVVRLERGIPTGMPICPIVYNLYLSPLDRSLESIPGAFYARFCDDLIFLHPDPAVVQRANQTIDQTFGDLGLRIKHEKDLNLYFNGAGRPSEALPAFRGTTHMDFLGCRVAFHGTISLKSDKEDDVLTYLRESVESAYAVLPGASLESAGRALCGVVNGALDPHNTLAHKFARPLRYIINDRRQLKQLDFEIALMIAQRLTGIRSVKAFRKVAYRTLRQRWRLESLVHRRNHPERTRG